MHSELHVSDDDRFENVLQVLANDYLNGVLVHSGRTRLKTRLLERMGWRVVRIRYSEWQQAAVGRLRGGTDKQNKPERPFRRGDARSASSSVPFARKSRKIAKNRRKVAKIAKNHDFSRKIAISARTAHYCSRFAHRA